MSLLVYVMGIFYTTAGLYHFIYPKVYIKMIKDFLPYPRELVYMSGIIEILLGLGVVLPLTRSLSAMGIIAMLIAIFPANLYMALHPEKWGISPYLLYLRLPMQLILIYWASIYV